MQDLSGKGPGDPDRPAKGRIVWPVGCERYGGGARGSAAVAAWVGWTSTQRNGAGSRSSARRSGLSRVHRYWHGSSGRFGPARTSKPGPVTAGCADGDHAMRVFVRLSRTRSSYRQYSSAPAELGPHWTSALKGSRGAGGSAGASWPRCRPSGGGPGAGFSEADRVLSRPGSPAGTG